MGFIIRETKEIQMKDGNNIQPKQNLFGFVSGGKDWKLNKLTLAFEGENKHIEENFKDQYYLWSLSPFRFSIILAIFFFDIFALLDYLLLPELKTIFWIIRFGIVTPALILVFASSYLPGFKKYMQWVILG